MIFSRPDPADTYTHPSAARLMIYAINGEKPVYRRAAGDLLDSKLNLYTGGELHVVQKPHITSPPKSQRCLLATPCQQVLGNDELVMSMQ